MRFYDLGPSWSKKWLWGKPKISYYDPFVKGGMVGYRQILTIEIEHGILAGDFLWNSHDLLIVSDKVLSVWGQFAKFQTYPVVIKGRITQPSYTGIAILGKGGAFDPVRSKARYKTLKPGGKQSLMGIEGLYFDEKEWDGSNLFSLPEFPRYCLATEELVREMKKLKITNCSYTQIEQVRF
jgi:hypothetical protein